MARSWTPAIDDETLYKLAGLTGVGWTASLLGFLGTMIGYGNGIVSRLLIGPRSLLYVGVALFLTTLGLDRLAKSIPDS